VTLGRLSALAAALVLTGALAGSATPSPAGRSAARNVVVFGGGVDPSGFNTALACCNATWPTWEAVGEALRGAFKLGRQGRWIHELVSKASADASGVSYTIRPNAYWYWGGKKIPVTYRDFVYTLQKITDPHTDAAGREGYIQLDTTHFSHRGDRQVTFFWRKNGCTDAAPCGAFAQWRALFNPLFPSFALRGLDFNKIWTDCICGNDGRPVASGPFFLAKYTKGEGTTLKANPYYYARAKLAEVDFRFTTDPNAEQQAMLGGRLDAIAPRFGPTLEQFTRAPGITFDHVPGYAFDHLALREGNAPAGPGVTKGASNVLLRAPWMRQAIMLGLDRRGVIDAVLGPLAGALKPLQSALFFTTETGYRPAFQRWDYNPSEALRILKKHCAAGSGPSVPTKGNAKIWQCAGLPATFTWTWGTGRQDWTTSEQVAKDNLQSIGIRLEERPLPMDIIFTPSGAGSGDFDIFQFRWITNGDPGGFYPIYRCSGVQNVTGYCNRRVDALLKAAQTQVNEAKRERLFQRADAILAADVAVIPMYQFPVVLVHRSSLLGMSPNPSGDPAWNIEQWHWRK
jgi:ABC-type transport system substrate-binding protein